MDFAHFWFQNGVTPPQPPAGIGNSLRFRGAQWLSRTFTSGNRKTFTYSAWVKRGGMGSRNIILDASNATSGFPLEFGTSNYIELYSWGFGTTVHWQLVTSQIFRDPGAWMHVVLSVDTTQAVAADRAKIYINGNRVTGFSATTYPTQNLDTYYNKAGESNNIGRRQDGQFYFNGYLSEAHFIDGTALAPTDFGEFNADGVWVPKEVSVANYGTNGFYLDFSDPDDIGADRSGNGNDFTATGFELTDTTSSNYDWVADSPTQNYATINPLYPGASTSNANLTTANTTGKPTILGVAGNGWDGTEAGWTTTGDVDFGQRTAADEISTRTIAAVPITNPSDHFEVITDTGANILTAAQAKFPNGLYWIKDRANSNNHQLVDSIRGNDVAIGTNLISKNFPYVPPSGNSVAWCWSAPETITNAAGTNGATLATTVHRNKDSGFAIIEFTGNKQSNTKLYHGLGKAPKFMYVKTQEINDWWVAYHASSGASDSTPGADWYYEANTQDQRKSYTLRNMWDRTDPDDNLITLGATDEANRNGGLMIAYVWAEVPGYSAFGSYTGNGSSTGDGPFIYTGFKPKFILWKGSNITSDWGIWDAERDLYNPADKLLFPSKPDAESTGSPAYHYDFVSNGFKIRSTNTSTINSASGTYIYAAFAEHPFGGSNISPTTAR